MKFFKKQQGLILVSVLIYLTIVTLAALAVLETAAILAYGNTNVIIKQQEFYLLEKVLAESENKILNTVFTEKNLQEQLTDLNIVDYSYRAYPDARQLLREWQEESLVKIKYAQAESVSELLGFRNFTRLEYDGAINTKTSLLIRVSAAVPDQESGEVGFLLQSLLSVPINETQEIEKNNLDRGERIAWIDVYSEE